MVQSIESLDDNSRELLGKHIGESVYLCITDPSTLLVRDTVQYSPIGYNVLRSHMAWLLTGEEIWKLKTETPFTSSEPAIQTVYSNLRKGAYPPLEDEASARELINLRATELLIEAGDDCLYWFSAISKRLDRDPQLADFKNNQTIASAVGVNDTVHRVVKMLLDKAEETGELIDLPKSHADFVALFYKAPRFFKDRGYKLQIETSETNPPEKRGRCPASTFDRDRRAPWHTALVDLITPIFLNSCE